jgi:hypothetical protein
MVKGLPGGGMAQAPAPVRHSAAGARCRSGHGGQMQSGAGYAAAAKAADAVPATR